MTDNTPSLPLPGWRPSVSDVRLRGLPGYKTAFALGIVGSGVAVLFFCAQWSIVLLGAGVMLVLSAMESEAFLLFVVYLMPLAWLLQGHNVVLGMHAVVVAGFFAGRLLRKQVRATHLFRPIVSRASLWFLCAVAFPVILRKGELMLDSARAVCQLATYVGFYFVILAWVDSRERMRKILWSLLLSTVVAATFAIYQQIIGGYTQLWLYLYPPDGNSEPWSGRSPSFLGYSNHLASYLNLVLPFALACTVVGQGKWKKLGGWTVGLGFVALLSTQSLGGLLGFVAVLVLAIFCFARNRKKAFALLAGICALICVLYLARNILNPAHTDEGVGLNAASRLLLWATAWNYFVQFPVIGVGWGNFVGLYGPDLSAFSSLISPGVLEVHNIYLQLLAETGLVGFVAFFHLIFRSWRQARTQFYSAVDPVDKGLAFGMLGALLSLLVHGFWDVPFVAQFGTLFWVLLALLVASGRLQCKPCHTQAAG